MTRCWTVPGNIPDEVVKATGRRWKAASDSCADRVGGTRRAAWRGSDFGPRRRPGGTLPEEFHRHNVQFAAMGGRCRFGGCLGSWSDIRSASRGKPCRREGCKGTTNKCSFAMGPGRVKFGVQVSIVDRCQVRSSRVTRVFQDSHRTHRKGGVRRGWL